MPTYVTRPTGSEAELLGVSEVGQLSPGAQVNVTATEAAVFVRQGEPVGMLGPGQHELSAAIPFTPQLFAPGPTSVCFVTTAPMSGIQVGGSLGALPAPTQPQPGLTRAYAELSVEVVDPAKLIATVQPSSGQDVHGWLNAMLFQAFQRTVAQLVASGEVSVGKLADSGPLVDHHLCANTPQLEEAGVRVVELTDLTVPETGPGSAVEPAVAGALAEVPAGHTVLGDVPLEAFAPAPAGPDAPTAPQAAQALGGGAMAAAPPYGGLPATADMGPAGYGGVPVAMAGSGAVGQPMASPYGQRAASRSSNGCLIGGIFAAIFVVLLAGTGLYWAAADDGSSASTSNEPVKRKPTPVRWSGRSTFSCTSGAKKIQDVDATLTNGTAISASGTCALTLVNVTINAPVALRVTGSAQITVDGGSIRGKQHSVEVGSGGKVILKGGATVRGRFKKSGNGKVLRIRD